MQYADIALHRLVLNNFSVYFLGIILVEWMVSYLVNRGLNKRFGTKLASLYNCEITFIGVIHHELSHAILALFTGAHVQKICLYRIPWTRKKKKEEMDENCLGYVTYSCRGIFPLPQIQNLLTGIAPIALGTASTFFCGRFLLNSWKTGSWAALFTTPWNYLVLYLMVSIAHHACPSGQDLKNARVGLVIVFIGGLLLPMPAEMTLAIQEIFLMVLGIIVLPAVPFVLLTNI